MLPKITGGSATNKSTSPTASPSKTVSAGNIASSKKLVYFGGTPTNAGGYDSRLTYFGGTPTSPYGYNPPPLTPSNSPDQFPKNDPSPDPTPDPTPDPQTDIMDKIRDMFSKPAVMTPEQRQAYLSMRRDAERAYEQMLAQSRMRADMARQDYRTNLRDVNRTAAGQGQDLRTAMAYLGMDTSPGVTDVGVESINDRARIAATRLEEAKARALAEIRAMKAQARVDRRQALTQAEAFQSSQLAANTQAQQDQLREILNGL